MATMTARRPVLRFAGGRRVSRPDTLAVLNNVGLQRWFPDEQIFPEEDEEFSATLKAVRHAHNKLAGLNLEEPFTAAPERTSHARLYYLV